MKGRYLNLISCLFISLYCAGALAHGNLIKGVVKDGTSGEALPGASVVLQDPEMVTKTNLLGNFRFDNLADGKYSIRISFIGYLSYTLEVEVANDETRSLQINLSPAPLELEEITVTGVGPTDHPLTTIHKIDIELRPVKSSQDVLRMIPGLVTAQHAGGGKAEQIFLRGFDIDHGTDIALSVDGMPVNMVSHAHGQGYADLHFVIPEVIDHVDFNKGPYYASVGDFNTAGYANFRTRNSLDNSLVKFEAGRFDTWRTVAMLDLLGKERVNQSAYVAAEYSFTNGPFVSPQNFNRLNIFGKYRGMVAEDKVLEISLSTFKSEWDASGQIPERAVTGGLIERFGAIDNTEGGLTGRSNINMVMTKLLDDCATFRNQLFYSHYAFELYSNFTLFLNDPVNGDAIRQKESREIYGYSGTYSKEIRFLGKPLMTESGAGIRYDDVSGSELSHVRARHTFLNPITHGDIDQINGSVFTEASWNLTSGLNVSAALRFDAFSFQYTDALNSVYNRLTKSATRISPKLNVHYNFNPNLQLYLKNGIGFHSNDSRVVTRQARETLPKAFGTDVGIFAKPFRNIVMNFAVWRLKLQQEFVYVGDEAVVELSGETIRYGLDLSLRYQLLERLFLDVDGNYAHARALGEPEGQNYIPLAPYLTSSGGITAASRNGLKASVRYRYVAERPANEDNSVEAKGYFLLDAGITYTKNKLQIGINATNLLNDEWNEAQFDTETRLPGETEGVSELTFTPGDPFFIKGGITFSFDSP